MTTATQSTTSQSSEFIPEDPHPKTTTHKEVIETVIASLEQNNSAMVLHSEQGYLWKFQYGSVEVYVQLTGESDEDLLTVWSSVMKLPESDQARLMRLLLEMNWSETLEACFALSGEQVLVKSQRTVAELSPGEISRAITLVATIADDHDEALKESFDNEQLTMNNEQ